MNNKNKNEKYEYDIHDGRIVVLFRHFVELIVRLTYLREDGKLEGLGK